MFGFGESKTKTISVAKPYCQPARGLIEAICKQYGVKIHYYYETEQLIDSIPALIHARVTVSSKQAEWCEYLLLRSQKFMLFSKPFNNRNLEWATKHKQMPISWNGKPLIEVGCKEGLRALKERSKKASKHK